MLVFWDYEKKYLNYFLLSIILVLIAYMILRRKKHFIKIYIYEDRMEIKYKKQVLNQIYYDNIKTIKCYYGSDKFAYMNIVYSENNETKNIDFELIKQVENMLHRKKQFIEYDF